ncbi:uncharacterized protein P884DRAFT_253291 [Thermothelomyces heterothallicus CBS 202.75]|uniref:uncharacterized protein n=1 Tax=Thermothelomyces heterothallicus CBS 202.75 TaxID=1149848 RepID=UPI00374421B4
MAEKSLQQLARNPVIQRPSALCPRSPQHRREDVAIHLALPFLLWRGQTPAPSPWRSERNRSRPSLPPC